MYKTNVTYENFDGEQVTKTLYFNLTKAEITKLQLSYKGGFDKYVESIIHPVDENGNKVDPDPQKVMDLFEMLILKAYGVRNDDGFVKPDDNKLNAFKASEAYSELFMRLLSDEKAQTEFFMGIMPRDVVAQAQKELEKNAEADNVVSIAPASKSE